MSSFAVVQLFEGSPLTSESSWRWEIVDDLLLQQIICSGLLGLACLGMAHLPLGNPAPLSLIFHALFLQNLLGVLSAAALLGGARVTGFFEEVSLRVLRLPALDLYADEIVEWVQTVGQPMVRSLRWWNLVAPLGAPGVGLAFRIGDAYFGRFSFLVPAATAAAYALLSSTNMSTTRDYTGTTPLQMAWSQAADEGVWRAGLPASVWAPLPNNALDLSGEHVNQAGRSLAGKRLQQILSIQSDHVSLDHCRNSSEWWHHAAAGVPSLSALRNLAASDEAALASWLQPRMYETIAVTGAATLRDTIASAPVDSTVVVPVGSEHGGGLVIDKDIVLVATAPVDTSKDQDLQKDSPQFLSNWPEHIAAAAIKAQTARTSTASLSSVSTAKIVGGTCPVMLKGLRWWWLRLMGGQGGGGTLGRGGWRSLVGLRALAAECTAAVVSAPRPVLVGLAFVVPDAHQRARSRHTALEIVRTINYCALSLSRILAK
eukprot:SAG31_NODE_374_length_16577_cov_9.902173_2_plen_487_part_00